MKRFFSYIYCFFAAFVFIGSFNVIVWGMDAAEVLENIEAAQSKVTDFRAYYTQETRFGSASSTTIIEQGQIIIKGSSIRKDIQKPTRKIVIFTAEKTIEKDILSGEIKTQDNTATNQTNPAFTGGNRLQTLLDNYTFTISGESNSEWTLIGTGKQVNLTITLKVNKLNNQVSHFEMSINNVPTVWMDNAYIQMDGLWVLTGTYSRTVITIGKYKQDITGKLSYENCRVNQGVSDSLFDIKNSAN